MVEKKKLVTLLSDAELRQKLVRASLKWDVRNVGIGQRELPTKIQHTFMEADGLGIKFQVPVPFEVPLVDDVWNDNERYIREFMASKHCEHPDRDRLIAAYFQIQRHIARHFKR